MDAVAKVPETSDLQISLYTQIVNWSNSENRTFLRQQMEESLAELLIDCSKFSEAFDLLSRLARESRTSEDHDMLIRVCLIQTKLQLSRQDLPKAKAALTEAQEIAESLEDVPEYDKAMIDMQSGIYHAEARDYLNAYNYFCEACSVFDKLKDPMYMKCIRYVLLCRFILNRAADAKIVKSKEFQFLYQMKEFEGMRAVADARSKGSIKLFETALKDYKDELKKDPLVFKHLHDTAIKDKLCELIELYSGSVEIARIAELIKLPADQVRRYLSEMIVDEKLAGSLDDFTGCLIIAPKVEDAASDIFSQIGKIVNTLKRKYGE